MKRNSHKKSGLTLEKIKSPVSWKRHAITLVLIIVAGITAYSNSIQGSFHYDDQQAIVQNHSLRTLSPAVIWRNNNRFRFIGFYSFALNYHLAGFNNTRNWHYVNIGLHIICALLLYWVLSCLISYLNRPESKIPLMTSILFAVHPLCSEPVNYLGTRHVLFYSLFCLSGMLSAILFTRTKNLTNKIIAIGGMVSSIFLGGISKEAGVFYVPVFIAATLLFFGRKTKISKHIIVPVTAIVAILFIILANRVKPLPSLFYGLYDPMTGENITFLNHLLTQVQIFWRYVSFLIPRASRLNVDHYVRIVKAVTFSQWLADIIPLLGIVFFSGLALKNRLRTPLFSFLSLWIVLGLFPYLLIPDSAEIMVEYKAYLSAMGFMGLVALGFEYVKNFVVRRQQFRYSGLIFGAIFTLLVFFSIKETRARNLVWQTEFTLWNDSVAKSPVKARPHYSLGNVYSDQGWYDEAIKEYRKAIELSPEYTDAYNNLGVAYGKKGLYDEAIKTIRESLRLNPVNSKAHNNLGIVYRRKGMYEEAIKEYKEALRLNPEYSEAYNNLGVVYINQGLYDEAIREFEEALRIDPAYREARNNLGAAR